MLSTIIEVGVRVFVFVVIVSLFLMFYNIFATVTEKWLHLPTINMWEVFDMFVKK